ncbi:polymorphic toxin-type HINT domain-containing protein [Mitsuaria sp. GD03876]|uniref:polymorphic toxin-type HINT domain-containing protein n=1 Tax=Mitsuaria sp. GD03876 TaxID=2975399 RepID=UPI002449856D|nr:polymorphic toxin-type HINT domain-containing protein [Mitsuaria sp. GD03876]MDH0864173.1 polymorphic toxin-type HINT domain-containing protein [Mitsuaria sp. GD03876]
MEIDKMKHPMAVLGGMRPLAAALALAGLSALGGAGTAMAQSTTVTRSVSYEYDAYGQLIRETLQPNDPALRQVTEFTRDPVSGVDFGLVSAKTVKWLDPVTGTAQSLVVERTGFDAKGRFPVSQTNAKSHTVTSSYDAATGAMLSMVDPNQLTASWQYDGWGRKTSESRADGTSTTWTYRQCVSGCGWAAMVAISQQWVGFGTTSQNQTAVPKEDFIDRLGRVVKSRTWGFDGTAVIAETAFSAQGYTASVARPRFEGTLPVWTYYERDDLGRVSKIRSPAADGSGYAETTYAYDGRLLSMVNAKGQQRVEERNGLGLLKAVTDALNSTTTYLYDGFGNPTRTRDPLGNQISVGYDALGRKTSLNDPDLGAMSYSVDPLGQIWKQRDAKGQETTFTFDELGRMVRRLEADLDSRWEYDTAAKGVGKLAESYTWVNGAKDVRRVVTYDAISRPSTMTASLDWDYITQVTYDGFGRPSVQSHTRRARGATSGGVTTAIVGTFNAQGYADKTYRRSDGTDTLVWQGLAIDAEGRDTRQQFGSGALVVHGYNANTGRLESVVSGASTTSGSADGTLQNDVYQYDVLGNVAYRAQLNGVGSLLQESFEYDELNRLKTSYIGSETRSFTYDALGNITSKANVGTYAYPASGYGAVRPHAVTSITGNVAGLVNPGFSYDASGNLVNGLNRAYTWSAADQPLTIDKLSGGQAVQRTEFVYGPEHERVKQVVRTMSGGQPQAMVNTVVYAGAVEKEIDVEKGVTIIRTSLGGDGYIEERIAGTSIDPETAGARTARFYLKDHLGSVIGVVNEAGQLLQRMSYDAWGRRRNVDGSDDSWSALGTIKNDQDNSGYTGHEQLDQLGLVHMNARLYDPIIGRHVSADPTIPRPENLQAFNRYSYVLNNAMVYVDPTGLTPDDPRETLANREAESPTEQKAEQEKSSGGEVKVLPTVYVYGKRNTAGSTAGIDASSSSKGDGGVALTHNFDFVRGGNAGPGTGNRAMLGGGSGASQAFWLHAALTAGSFMPVVGSAFAVADAAVSYMEGDTTGALIGLSAAAIGVFSDAGLAKTALMAAREIKGAKAATSVLKGCCCFAPGTPVLAETGLVPIEQITVGTRVQSWDEATGRTALKPVVAVILNEGRPLYRLSLVEESGRVTTTEVTDNHPYWVEGAGWVESLHLKRGMKIATFENAAARVLGIEDLGRAELTYNLTVADFHTYFAGESRTLVHNTCKCELATKAVSSRIKESPRLVKEADVAGKSHQESLDRLMEQLRKGNTNPGIGTKPIGSGLSEARARDGARVYFRETENGIEILGKSSKANQESVIKEVLRVFGN